MKITLIIGGAVLLLLFILIRAGSDDKNPTDRIAESCRQQYGDRGDTEVEACKLRLMLRLLSEREITRDKAAQSGAR